MRSFLYIVILASMLAAYLSSPQVGLAPAPVKLLPDLLSVIVLLYVVAVGARQQFRNVSPKYWFIFGSLAVVLAFGPIANGEAPGPIINGMRYYLRALPFFFLPAVLTFDDRHLKRYALLVLALSVLQAPLAIQQRLHMVATGRFTGDEVYGTLMISGIMSLFLIAVLCILASLMARGRFPARWFIACFLVLVVPMSINETKVSMVLLPIGLLCAFVVGSPRGRRLVITGYGLALVAVAGLIFVPLYNYYNTINNPYPMTVTDWFKGDTLEKYFRTDARVGSQDEAGRMDALLVPFEQLRKDPVTLAMGLGLGNASQSSLGAQFSGRYKALYWPYVQTSSISAFLFELGVIGALLVMVLHAALLRDAVTVMKRDRGLLADIAPGYIGAWIVITSGLFYLSIHIFESLSFTFFFISGLLAARAAELKRDAAATRR